MSGKPILTLLLLLASVPVVAEDRAAGELCQYGVVLAQRAYLSGTFDAKYPDFKKLDYLVDYWGDQMIVPYDKPVALRSVRFIAERVRDAGYRRPTEDVLFMPVREALVNECAKYN